MYVIDAQKIFVDWTDYFVKGSLQPQEAVVRIEWYYAAKHQTPCRHSISVHSLFLTVVPFSEQVSAVRTHLWHPSLTNICFETKSSVAILSMAGSIHSSPGTEISTEVISDFLGNSNSKASHMKLS